LKNSMKKKIAIVVQRYGTEVNGGSELYARLLAEHLIDDYDVEVLTTCALDYITWGNYFPEGMSYVNNVKVRRFHVDKQRDMQQFIKVNEKKMGGLITDQVWIDEQGPYCPSCIEYIEKNRDNYDVFIFVTYLYYLTVMGMGEVSNKAILVPTAHDEPYIYLEKFKKVFTSPRAIVFLTEEEKSFVHNLFMNESILSDVIGAGIDVPELDLSLEINSNLEMGNYLVYAGRIDISKNCPELFNYFIEYKKRNPSNLKLCLMGSEKISIPKHPDIISLGFVSDEDKFRYLAGAKMLVLPSQFESLSFAVLEAMALGVPVVVNEKAEVLKGHCKKSSAGLYYSNYFEFEGCLIFLLSHSDIYKQMSINAKEYVRANYRWDVVIDKYKKIIEYL